MTIFRTSTSLLAATISRLVIVWTNIILSVLFAYFTVNGLVFYWVMMILGFGQLPWDQILLGQTPITLVPKLFRNSFQTRSVAFYLLCWAPMLSGAVAHAACLSEWTHIYLKPFYGSAAFGSLWWKTIHLASCQLTDSSLRISNNNQADSLPWSLLSASYYVLQSAKQSSFGEWANLKIPGYLLADDFRVVFLASIPNQTLRIHHYILGLLLLPGVGFQTTLGLLYQGLLAGFC